MKIPVISIVAKSGTGKTTLLEKLIAELKRRGHRVGAIKHDAHKFEIDHPGKDSWRLTQAGADTMVVCSATKTAMVKQYPAAEEPSVLSIVATCCADMDIVLTEGFKRSNFPKIEVHRKERSDVLLCRGDEHDATLIAVASDQKWTLDVPAYDLNDVHGICSLLEKRFLSVRPEPKADVALMGIG